MNRTIVSKSGHTLFVESIKFDDLPENVKAFDHITDYKKHYVVKNWDKTGVVFFYMASGRIQGKGEKEIVVWYSRGGFWSGYGLTSEEAINGAQKDGWMYA